MDYQAIRLLLIGILTFDFIFNKALGILNNRSRQQPVPAELEGIYDQEKYAQSQAYQSEVFNFSLISSSFSFLMMLAILWFGGFGWLDEYLRGAASVEPLTSLYFFGVVYLASDLMGIPFELYGTFVIEEKYGFNKMTFKTYLTDKFKSYLLALLLGGVLASLFIVLVMFFEENFWIYFWVAISVFMIFINMFYTSLIIPMFNKLSPLEDGPLKTAITNYSEKVGFPLHNIFVIDGSKRSSKGNAFFSGLGKKKKVVLYDTLIEKHTEEELVGVLAHEVGHFKKKHIIWSMVSGILQTGFMLWLLSKFIFSSEISWALGGHVTALHLNVFAFAILFSPLSTVIGILMNLMSRKNEYEADAYAVTTYDKEPLITALKKLTSDSLGNLTPHPWYEFMNYSHPSLLKRIRAMKAIK
ncbi:M48 family metallopeptidase [Reichenbachiella carrageenanivorans]|uniref:M48 family metallopeptidase n=1 Tax=Reichenbachiella carrageenanivorans TaxID=2979869 RepID=A0ABY6CVH2_9BACT|nr:M48 family metallopeptidase [Reichenbachiella carrageenanivorans]UXX77906.1 M48 family metallopeptidase [Reichenbachiella carrageenanivorans]